MAFVNFGGVAVPPDAYAYSAIFLLPINSALNPIVYSNVWTVVHQKFKKRKRVEKKVARLSNTPNEASASKSSKL